MIERFNFYDLYGYVIPGFVLIALFCVPFGLAGRGWPSTELASAVAALTVSYVAGIVLQAVGTDALPSKSRDANKKQRYPSNVILDDDDPSFSQEFKANLQVLIQKDFGLAATADDSNRAEAFRACLAALLANKAAGYAEQFQGLYSLCRGLLLSIGLAIPFFLGWAIGVFHSLLLDWDGWSVIVAFTVSAAWCLGFAGDDIRRTRSSRQWAIVIIPTVVFLVVGCSLRYMPAAVQNLFVGPMRTALWLALPFVAPLMVVLTDKKRLGSRWGRYSIALSTLVVISAFGFVASAGKVSSDDFQRLLGCAVVGIILLVPLWRAYRSHTVEFAATVYRHYYAMQKLASTAGNTVSPRR
jgi:hypothetical protein